MSNFVWQNQLPLCCPFPSCGRREVVLFPFSFFQSIGTEKSGCFLATPVSYDAGFSCHVVVSAPSCAQQPPRLCHPSSSSHFHFFPAVTTWTDVTMCSWRPRTLWDPAHVY